MQARSVHLNASVVEEARQASVVTASTRCCGGGAGKVPRESSIEATRLPSFHPCTLEEWRPPGVEAREDRRLEALRTLGLFRTLVAGVEALEEALAPLRFSASLGRYSVIHSTALAAGWPWQAAAAFAARSRLIPAHSKQWSLLSA